MYNGGAVVDAGGFGCLFIPALKCNNKNNIRRGFVSKMQIKHDGDTEYNKIMKIKSIISKKIPNYSDYFILDIDICYPSQIETQDLKDFDNKCGKLFSRYDINASNINSHLQDVNIINMVNGGITIDDFLLIYTEPKYNKLIFLKLYNYKHKALIPANKSGILNCDIKPNNFLISLNTTTPTNKPNDVENTHKIIKSNMKLRLIDWGLSTIYDSSTTDLHNIIRHGNYFQFNSPFSSNLFNEGFLKYMQKYLLSISQSKETISYKTIYKVIFNFLIYILKNNKYRHLNHINHIFVKFFEENHPNIISRDELNNYILNNYTLKYICNYMTEVVIKFTINNYFDVLLYYKKVYVKNVDLWGYYLSFIDLFLNEKNYNAYDDLKKFYFLLLTYSYKEINHKLMHDKLKYIYYKLFGEQIKLNTQTRKIKTQ